MESNIAEGWKRYTAGEMAHFLRFALASLEEAKRRLRDGIDRGYFQESECAQILTAGNRCGAATMALIKALQGFAKHPPRR